MLFEKVAKMFSESHENLHEMELTKIPKTSVRKRSAYVGDDYDDSYNEDIPLALKELSLLSHNTPQRDILLANAALAYLNSARLSEIEGNTSQSETYRTVADFALEACKSAFIREKLYKLADTTIYRK
jgi:hypothetical protein